VHADAAGGPHHESVGELLADEGRGLSVPALLDDTGETELSPTRT
ncbi:MAG: hypothetical protein QOG80_2700, partial [Pseudonocardiales bacterium]|nr:hypothetical protein [Pseudonocardiales bacterium]